MDRNGELIQIDQKIQIDWDQIELMGHYLTAIMLRTKDGIHVSVYGGDTPHIGAITIISENNQVITTEFPSHKDSRISIRWATVIRSFCACPVVVEAGVHYDNLSEKGIKAVLEKAEVLLERMLRKMEEWNV